MVTIRASEPGITQVDRARRRKGWLKQSEIWCRIAHTSRATLKRFWRREPIDQGAFIAIYQAVGIEEWEAMAEVEVFASQKPMDLSAMPDVPVFFGRSIELKNLTDWSTECRLIALWGMGGIGKTAPTAEWVESQVRFIITAKQQTLDPDALRKFISDPGFLTLEPERVQFIKGNDESQNAPPTLTTIVECNGKPEFMGLKSKGCPKL